MIPFWSWWGWLHTVPAAPLIPSDFDVLAVDLITTEPISIDTGLIGGTPPILSSDSAPDQIGAIATSGSREVAVFTFGEVVLDHDVTVTGERPLVILSHGDLRLSAAIDAAAVDRVPGAGGYYGGRCNTNDGDGFGPGAGLGLIQANGNGAGGGGAFGGDGG
ncbi:MAG TPA: hypothetical protein ENK18_08745, partial [Deltaproteobacteria bacterium]|nr:hypothetical protein [Deltaproteobacteria bacterium]